MTTKNLNNIKCIELEPEIEEKAKRSVIWLHGLGANGQDFVPIVPELKLNSALGIRFIFPTAPTMPVTINHGHEMPAWFDIDNVSIAIKVDLAGITRSIETVQALIAKEVARGVPANQIILAGFSQGSVIALLTGLTYHQPLAGVIALSGYLPASQHFLSQANPANQRLPIFIAHGTQDQVVPFDLGSATGDGLKAAGFPVTFRGYPMAHSVCLDEINDISAWIQTVYA